MSVNGVDTQVPTQTHLTASLHDDLELLDINERVDSPNFDLLSTSHIYPEHTDYIPKKTITNSVHPCDRGPQQAVFNSSYKREKLGLEGQDIEEKMEESENNQRTIPQT
ncbi:uncharacterized protein N7459_007827 [Penicillium hispanicum]|uniref:uncharacterized protein n=1 Tax=Penicillium hispanicum TaxID=1080232 RepID=UPI00253F6897|nr:uncharacterized protein N7459_007827 [Penicillium hispanicum]KAJ5573400.1 hypothetical protein N7459_007827 [Penicillium hispanicum]